MSDTNVQKFVIVTNVCDGEVFNYILPAESTVAEIKKFIVSLIFEHEVHDMGGDFEKDFLTAAAEGRWADALKVYYDYDRECESGSQYRWDTYDLDDLSYAGRTDPQVIAVHFLSSLNDEGVGDSASDA